MNILVPLNDLNFLAEYINAGANEFYMGFYDEKWFEKFGEYSDINRMSGFRKKANSNSFQDILSAIEKIKNNGADIYITFNSASYSEEELEYIDDYFKKLASTNIDGVILSNPELVELAVKNGLPVVISTIAGVYNTDIVQFYKKLGAKRIILPRDLNMNEIENIVTKDDSVEYEIFIMRNGCKFSDANCLGFHRTEMCSICASLEQSENNKLIIDDNFKSRSSIEYTDKLLKHEFHLFSCGICGIYDFIRLNISAGKIVGRTDNCKSVCDDISLISKNIEIALKCHSREEYLSKMIFPDNRNEMCINSMSCYYPEIRF